MTTPLNAAPADLAAVEKLVRASGTSFYHGMRILPPDRRAAMYGIYGFCRVVDDIADEPGELDAKRTALDQWRARIAALAHGTADDPVTRVLLLAQNRFSLRAADFIAVIDGMQTDAETTVVAPSLAELDLYCDQVASAVGRLSVRAFGDASPAADEVAHHLGRALQLTNILRDIAEDADRGRLYLPREWLQDSGLPLNPAQALTDPRLTQVCEKMARRAQDHFASAESAMARCAPRAMRPARLMSATYHAVLNRLQKRGWHALTQPVSVPKWQKLFLAARFALLG